MTTSMILDFAQVSRGDVARVGGKNASLGELIGALVPQGIAVPPGFATTSDAFRMYLVHNDLGQGILDHLAEYQASKASLAETGTAIRSAILAGEWPAALEQAIVNAYRELTADTGDNLPAVAVQRDGRRFARGQLCRTAGNYSQRQWRGRAAGCVQTLLCLTLHRSGDCLPNRTWLWRRCGSSVDRGSADGASRPGRLWRDVLYRY